MAGNAQERSPLPGWPKMGQKNRNSQLFWTSTNGTELRVYPKEAQHGAAKCIGPQPRTRPSSGVKIENLFFHGTEILRVRIVPLNTNNHGGSGGCPPGGGPGAEPPAYGRHFWRKNLGFQYKKPAWKVRNKRNKRRGQGPVASQFKVRTQSAEAQSNTSPA